MNNYNVNLHGYYSKFVNLHSYCSNFTNLHIFNLTKSNDINLCKFPVYFARKTYFFLFYTPIFIKHPHQFVHSTIYFI